MRVLMVTPSYYPITGGAETLIRNLSIKLNKSGVQADILTFNMNKKWKPKLQSKIEYLDGITVYKIPGLNWLPIVHSDRLTLGVNLIPHKFRNIMEAYDVIHFHVGDLSIPVFSLKIGKPKIAHFHGPLDFYKRSYPSRKILLRMANLYVSISCEMHQALIDLGVPENNVKYIPNGVDSNTFKPAGDKQKNLLLFVGRITSDKGLHVLLKSLYNIKTKIELVIIGPSQWDTNYFQKIQDQIRKENKRGVHKITYLGEQRQSVIVEWCQKASLFVLPSFKEACGIAILEALACETAVVATNIEGIREVVFDGVNGLLVPTNDSIKLASSIQYLLDNEIVRNKFGQEGRKLVKANFSYDSAIKQFHQVYKELASGN
jgi:glycosyltransferase involved in cell wall biosynthesis